MNQDKELQALLEAGNHSKMKNNKETVSNWDGRINIYGLNKVSPQIKDFIEKQGDGLGNYAKRALIAQLKKDGFVF